jgi:hypothetical protein
MQKVQLKMELKPARMAAAVPSLETARMELKPGTRTEALIGTAAVRQVRSTQVSNVQACNEQVRSYKTFLFFLNL